MIHRKQQTSMFNDLKTINLKFENVTEEEMWALAQVAKRLHYEDLARLAAHDDETPKMVAAVEKLQTALDKAGFQPQ